VQQAEAGEVRQCRILLLQDMTQRIRALVAEILRVREFADAEGVADEDDHAFH
jgi:hypothetical protein